MFDIRRHRADGVVDPSGLVKGWAVEEAVAILLRAGGRNFAVNAGGDIVVRGGPAPGRAWRVGIQHPEIRQAMAAVLEVRDLAVATSGAYERGEHVIDARSGAPPTDLLSATVVGPSLTFADAYATARLRDGHRGHQLRSHRSPATRAASSPRIIGSSGPRASRRSSSAPGSQDPTEREPAGATAVDPAALDPDHAAP